MTIYTLPVKKIMDVPEELYAGVPFSNLQLQPLLIQVAEKLSPSGKALHFDQENVKKVIATAIEHDVEPQEMDAWLAPRIHSAIRVPRRVAGDKGFWAWVAIAFCQEYVYRRWSQSGVVSRNRYTGELLRNAISRLWWGAEMVRNGPSYADVSLLFRRAVTAQFALELKYSWFRPAAIAFVRVAEGADGKTPLTDAQIRSLSGRINAYLSLTALEAVGEEESMGDDLDEDWWEGSSTLKDLLDKDNLRGPEDGSVSGEAIARVEDWFRQISEEVV